MIFLIKKCCFGREFGKVQNPAENGGIMKVLIFTHKNDIDGMGNAVLAKLAFDNVDYILCETFDLIHKVNECINSNKIRRKIMFSD